MIFEKDGIEMKLKQKKTLRREFRYNLMVEYKKKETPFSSPRYCKWFINLVEDVSANFSDNRCICFGRRKFYPEEIRRMGFAYSEIVWEVQNAFNPNFDGKYCHKKRRDQ